MRTDRDVIDGMSKAMGSMGLYLVLVFFAAQFVAFFKWTNLGLILAVTGADFITAMNLDGPIVFVPFILMCCFVNLMLGSASAQWAITAPIFVPMLMTIGYTPQVIQAAYRIGDSTTNIITPMMSYFGLILAFASRYDRKLGIGTIIATMLPYSVAFLVAWMVLFYVWVFGLGMPVGPGTELMLPEFAGRALSGSALEVASPLVDLVARAVEQVVEVALALLLLRERGVEGIGPARPPVGDLGGGGVPLRRSAATGLAELVELGGGRVTEDRPGADVDEQFSLAARAVDLDLLHASQNAPTARGGRQRRHGRLVP